MYVQVQNQQESRTHRRFRRHRMALLVMDEKEEETNDSADKQNGRDEQEGAVKHNGCLGQDSVRHRVGQQCTHQPHESNVITTANTPDGLAREAMNL